jgi:hypothetical protein
MDMDFLVREICRGNTWKRMALYGGFAFVECAGDACAFSLKTLGDNTSSFYFCFLLTSSLERYLESHTGRAFAKEEIVKGEGCRDRGQATAELLDTRYPDESRGSLACTAVAT